MNVNTTTEQRMTISEGKISWLRYTELTLHNNKTVTIHRHYSINRIYGVLPKNIISHPLFYHELIWRENKKKIAEKYFVPDVGWCEIDNPQHMSSYK